VAPGINGIPEILLNTSVPSVLAEGFKGQRVIPMDDFLSLKMSRSIYPGPNWTILPSHRRNLMGRKAGKL